MLALTKGYTTLTKGYTTLTKYAETPTKDPMYVVRKTLHTVRLVYGWYATICLDTGFYVRLSYFGHMTLLQLRLPINCVSSSFPHSPHNGSFTTLKAPSHEARTRRRYDHPGPSNG